MRLLTAVVVLCISTTASAADPACLEAVHTQFDAVAQQATPDEAAILFEVLDESDIAGETCDGPGEDWDDDAMSQIQAPAAVCAGMRSAVKLHTTTIAKLARMAADCHASPSCTSAQESRIVSALAAVNRSMSNLLTVMAKLGC